MSKYSKAISVFIGGAIPFLITLGVDLPPELSQPEVVAGITALLALIFTFFGPKNSE